MADLESLETKVKKKSSSGEENTIDIAKKEEEYGARG
jgi:hypothetical protein